IGNSKGVLLQKNYGNPSPDSGVDPAYLIGSLTKQFTATAILLLEQRGLLQIEDPISKHLNNIPSDKAPITIHQLLTHTAGLADDYWDQHKDLNEAEYIDYMLSKPLDAVPGTRFSYANFGYHLLAKIVEIISQNDYEQFLVEELFRPNKINSTGFKLVDWKEGQVVRYQDWTTAGSEAVLENPLDRPVYLQPEGSGGLLSTTRDLFRWYQAVFCGDKILNSVSRKKLLTVEKESYACGWKVYSTPRKTTLIQHGGYDSWVGVVTGLYNYADEDLVLIFLGNTHMGQMLIKEDLMNNIEALLFGGLVQFPPSTVGTPDASRLKSLPGTYVHEGQSLSVSEGKLPNQLRLRTSDPALIREILLPENNLPGDQTDIQLAYILEHLASGDYEPLREVFFNEAPFEAVLKRYQGIWSQLTTAMGPYRELRLLHILPGSYEGQFELQLFAEIKFEQGSYLVRAFRNQEGRMHVQPLHLPEKLEIYLVPGPEGAFRYWNVKSGTSTTLTFGEGQAVLNGRVALTKG
ncbi:MAG: beta-lactamase family protein, partial [Phaeodactylibacter sp.]|nr:beta-lactamase family protein [Phaeodactylibacter sp.]